MKANKLIKRDFNGLQINQRTKDSFFNATELLALHNRSSMSQKRFKDFWENQSTKAIYSHLSHKLGIKNLHESNRGKGGGTWMQEDLLVFFFNWLNKVPNIAFTRDEKNFCESLKLSFDGLLTIIEQFKFGKYYVDIFIPEIQLCIEFDEDYHKRNNQKDKDVKRQKFIEKEFGVKFIRQDIRENYGVSINKIIKEWRNI